MKARRKLLMDYLVAHPCVDCGETDPVVLEFDHVRGKKISAVTKMMYNKASLEKLKAEIAKCDVRSANCHRRKTTQRGVSRRQALKRHSD